MCRLRRRLGWALVAGVLVAVVLATDAAPAEGAEPARVMLQAQPQSDGSLRVTAAVIDGQGAPVAETPVVFKVRTTFGWLTVADVTTGKDGTAQATLPAARTAGEIAVEAGEDGTVRAAILIGAPAPTHPRIRPGRAGLRGLSPQPGFISPYPIPLQVALFGAILAGIWITYGYVVWLLLRIRRQRQA